MAITTLDQALAGMQPPVSFEKAASTVMVAGRAQSLLYVAGCPGTAVAPTPGIGGTVLSSGYLGQLPFTNPVSGNTYLARLCAQSTIAGTLLLCDRLWHNSGMNVTTITEQVFTSSAQIPARDATGTNNGVGVYAGLEVSAATNAVNPVTLTLKYTNSAGVAGQTATNVFATTATAAVVGSFYQFGLAAGDVGIQKAQSLTINTSWGAGTVHVVLYRVLARLELGTQIPNALDALTGGFTQMYNNTVPFLLFIPNANSAANINGTVTWTQG